ncbi:MAG TPA: Rv3654c family TadE-like protein [Jatrophihabitans sp.]|jgi:secretion/DNA translocation related TadE-like protein|nr:Rv3654c family TadE-like protein [Jatrophihabitans sp.]
MTDLGRHGRCRRADRGSATIWVVACCALLMTMAGAATVRALAVLARHRAEASADLAALAAAGRIGVGGDACEAAARVAGRNAARLRTCTVQLAPDGRSGTVSVSVALTARLPLVGSRQVVATARAAREPGRRREMTRAIPPNFLTSP